MLSGRRAALCDARWEAEEQRSVEAAYDYRPTAQARTLEDPDGPSDWDLR
ncbi:hypothetical protein GFY24_00935 [Nocardia sp. SYP-A9097]|nr:hypothetical protein [Nocardia sp. SYP-A9097]MRH86042.1 hypothetical protein [Nocardia sp. SYP-A9097]